MIDTIVSKLEELAHDARGGVAALGKEGGIRLISAWEDLLSKSNRAALADVANALGTLREALDVENPNPATIGQNLIGLGDAVEYVAGLSGAPFVLSDLAQLFQEQGQALTGNALTPGQVEEGDAVSLLDQNDNNRDNFGARYQVGDSGDIPTDADPRRGTLGANEPPLSDSMPFDGEGGARVQDTGEHEWHGSAYADPAEHQ